MAEANTNESKVKLGSLALSRALQGARKGEPLNGGISLLLSSFQGCKLFIKRVLGLDVEFNVTNNYKHVLLERSNNKPQYPICYITPTSGSLLPINSKAMTLQGITGKPMAGNAVSVATVFPFKIQCELHYMDSDFARLMGVYEDLVILASTKSSAFQVMIENSFEMQVVMNYGLDFPIVPQDHENSTDPGSSEMILPFELQTMVGRFDRHTLGDAPLDGSDGIRVSAKLDDELEG